ncbi:hypothetical protein [Roseobacter ponti]|uniref:Uncharacterized protein n=1 Tax=Roseobacter ponti TaxID=1891787 RepID=A0A858SRC6_9RHOB|nr:hypothetical protein [Roseobacter ponti]QJF50547.1 hypothetical protein G3256_04935 [Roseobacter ponti]
MIWNIVDRRSRDHRWREVNAVIENITHDNFCEDSDIFEEQNDAAPIYAEKVSVLLHDAILWAEEEKGKVTLYL